MTDNVENNYDICNRYDTNILNDLDENTRSLFEEISEKCIDRNLGIGNTTLMKLILNNRKNKKPSFKKISGPMSLTVHWSEEYKKMVYIFGEYHGYENSCPDKECPEDEKMSEKQKRCVKKPKKQVNKDTNSDSINIVDYLKELFKNTNVFIDFFIELNPPEYSKKDEGKYPTDYAERYQLSHISSIWRHFIPCINVESRTKKDYCELSRVHYIDIRNTYTEYDMFNKFHDIYHHSHNCYEISNDLILETNMTFINYYTDEYLDQFKEFILELENDPKNAIIKETKNNIYIKKEIDRSYLDNDRIYEWFENELDNYLNKNIIYHDNGVVRTTVSEYIKNRANKINSLIEDKPNIVHNIKINQHNGECYWTYTKKQANNLFEKNKELAEFNKQLCNFASGITSSMLNIFSLRMDIYTISRLFKKFNVNSNSNQPDEAYNSIIYAGNAHSEVYRNFLTNNGFELVAIKKHREGQKKNERCLNINNIPQPFFTGPPLSSIS